MDDALHALHVLLRETPVAILDGGLASELERYGLDLDDPLWSAKVLLERPEAIARVHLDYFEAGADIAIGASYQATFEGFAARGVSRRETAALIQSSVRLAREASARFQQSPAAVDRPLPLVAASVGCYGASRHDGSEYRGQYGISRRELMAFHRERLKVLLDAGPDLLACETIPCMSEAEVLIELLERIAPTDRVPAWISFCCRDDRRVAEGQLLAECVALAERSDAVAAVGVNCTAPQHVAALLCDAAEQTSKPLVAYPNSGEVWDSRQHRWGPGGAAACDIPTAATGWRDAGARLIGGCCRTTPVTIRALAVRLRSPSAD